MRASRLNNGALAGAAITLAAFLSLAPPATAQVFDLSWYTIDGGGEMFTAGGNFELSGTNGQPDAGRMRGGDFELLGGFWPGPGGGDCDPCDANCDGVVDAFDVEPFIAVLFGGPQCAPCTGDANGDGVIDAFDIEPFVACLVP